MVVLCIHMHIMLEEQLKVFSSTLLSSIVQRRPVTRVVCVNANEMTFEDVFQCLSIIMNDYLIN